MCNMYIFLNKFVLHTLSVFRDARPPCPPIPCPQFAHVDIWIDVIHKVYLLPSSENCEIFLNLNYCFTTKKCQSHIYRIYFSRQSLDITSVSSVSTLTPTIYIFIPPNPTSTSPHPAHKQIFILLATGNVNNKYKKICA